MTALVDEATVSDGPALPIDERWHSVPPGADGPELRHDEMPVRFLADGRVMVLDRNRGREIESARRASDPREATEIAIEALLRFDLAHDAKLEIEARERDRERGLTRDRIGDRSEVRELRRRLDDPVRVVRALGLEKGARKQPRGLTISCPWHDEHTPSCSVRVARDGTIAVRCHGCGETGDVFTLIARVHGLDTRADFPRVLELAADIAGVTWRRAG